MLSSSYSLWFVPLCLLAGVAYASLLYGNKKGFAYSARVKRILFVSRALTVSLIAFLLLRPSLLFTAKESERPILLVGIDNSESIAIGKDSVYYRKDFPSEMHKLLQRLSRDYQVDTYLISDSARQGETVNYEGKATDLGCFFEMADNMYAHRNLGACVLISDGICTQGEDPLYAARRLSVPIYTVAMGDTTERRDARIAKIHCNETVCRNNFFPLEILLRSHRLSGKECVLKVFEKQKVLFEKNIRYSGNDFSEWVRLNLEAGEAGYLHYRVVLQPVEGEWTESNNVADVVVQVVDERKKIAIVYAAPHPDVAALTESLADNPMYTVECYSAEDFRKSNPDYDLLVLHQLPSTRYPMKEAMDKARKEGTSLLFFAGVCREDFRPDARFGLQIQRSGERFNDVYPVLNADFSDFSLPASMPALMSYAPPLQLAFGHYRIPASANVCIYQKINGIKTDYPLMFQEQTPEQKVAFFLGEGWWRWRIHAYMNEGSHDSFDALMEQVLQYLSVKEDKSRFRVKAQGIYAENERIVMDAELYNKSMQMVNQPEVKLKVISERDKGQTYDYVFSRFHQGYHLEIESLPEGDYRWTAETVFQGERFHKEGRFCVQAVQKEAVDLVARHQLLANLSDLNEGRLFQPKQLALMEKSIRSNDKIKILAKYTKKHHLLLNNGILFCLLALLLGGEWFLRKWSGNY